MSFAKKNFFSEKRSIVDVWLGSKYPLTSGWYWWGKLIVENKSKNLINFNLEMSGKKIVMVFRGVFRTKSNIYGGFSGK